MLLSLNFYKEAFSDISFCLFIVFYFYWLFLFEMSNIISNLIFNLLNNAFIFIINILLSFVLFNLLKA